MRCWWTILLATAVLATEPQTYVVAVGVESYKDANISTLKCSVGDAKAFAEAFLKAGVPAANVTLLTSDQTDHDRLPRKSDILFALQRYRGKAVEADTLIFFFAGHGVEQDGQAWLLTFDSVREQLADTAVPESSIRETLGRMRGKSLLFIDTCFAGNALGTFRSASRELARLANELASSENGVVVFASSSGRQLSEERDEWGNGAFTKSVVEGLSGKADLTRTGRITFKALDFYVSEEVRRLTSGRQTPVTISPAGVPDFTVARVI